MRVISLCTRGALDRASRGRSTAALDGMMRPTQRARGMLPDALKDDSVILVKACPELRLTYELRLAAFMAQQTRRRLLIITTVDCAATPELLSFAQQYGVVIQRNRA